MITDEILMAEALAIFSKCSARDPQGLPWAGDIAGAVEIAGGSWPEAIDGASDEKRPLDDMPRRTSYGPSYAVGAALYEAFSKGAK